MCHSLRGWRSEISVPSCLVKAVSLAYRELSPWLTKSHLLVVWGLHPQDLI